jgi:hypothetical protein
MASAGDACAEKDRHDNLIADLESGRVRAVAFNYEMLEAEEVRVMILKVRRRLL